MTQIQFLMDWGRWAGGFAFWTCLLWPAAVRPFWPWHRHEWGWNMVIKTELIALALLASTLHAEFGVKSYVALLWVVVCAVTAIPVVVIWRAWIIWSKQRDGARDDATARQENADQRRHHSP